MYSFFLGIKKNTVKIQKVVSNYRSSSLVAQLVKNLSAIQETLV